MQNNSFLQSSNKIKSVDIQPLFEHDLLYEVHISLSIIVLVALCSIKIAKNIKITEHLLPILLSEQQGFRYFTQNRKEGLIRQFSFFFFSIQLAYILYPIIPFKHFAITSLSPPIIFLILVCVFYLLLVIKTQLFLTIEKIIPWKIEGQYYLFSYTFCLFIVSSSLLLLIASKQFLVTSQLLFVCISILTAFYVWLFLRWLITSTRYKLVTNIYFFLYLCTLEIAPMLVLWKILLI